MPPLLSFVFIFEAGQSPKQRGHAPFLTAVEKEATFHLRSWIQVLCTSNNSILGVWRMLRI